MARVAALTRLASVVPVLLTAGCACFGASSTEPVSGRDVVRNVVLMAAAVVALVAA